MPVRLDGVVFWSEVREKADSNFSLNSRYNYRNDHAAFAS